MIGVVGLVVARRTVGGQRATLCALSQQVLRLVLLRMDRYALGDWTVTALSLGGQPVSWNVPNRARLIVMGSFYGRHRTFSGLPVGQVTFHGYLLRRREAALLSNGPVDSGALLAEAEPLVTTIVDLERR